jgi:two-component system response regulator LytT
MKKEPITELASKAVNTLAANALLEKEKKAQISFPIRLEDRIYFVLVENIALIYVEGERVYLLDVKGEKHVVSKTLDAIDNAIASQQFYRINRQMIVNRQAIKDVKVYPNQRMVVQLTLPTPEDAVVPRAKVKPFLSWIEKG